MSSSERSSLLPLRAGIDPTTPVNRRPPVWWALVQKYSVTATICGIVVVLLAVRGSSHVATVTGPDTQWSSADAQLAVWDSVKDTMSGVPAKTQQIETVTEQDMAQVWNITEQDASKFKETVSSWWESDAEPNEEKIQQNFQAWWASASAAEQSWWGKLVSTLKHDEEESAHWLNVEGHNVAKTTKHLWNATEHEVARDWKATEKAAVSGWDATEHEVARDWKATEKGAERGWEATEKGAERGWDATKQTTEKDEERVGEWWQNTETTISKDTKAVDRTIENWWHATTVAAHEDWDKGLVTEDKWWNATRAWFTNEVEHTHRPILYLNTSRAFYLLSNGEGWFDYSEDYFRVRPDTQINQAFCGVASAAAVLNSIPNVGAAVDPVYEPYPFVTQTSILKSDCVNSKVVKYSNHYDGIMHPPGGLSLLQVRELLECNVNHHEFDVSVHHVDADSDLDQVREALRSAILNPDARVLVNYDRKMLGQSGSGHFSPLVAYNLREDMVLINDVAKYKYPPVWVSTALIFDAMNTVDACGDYPFPAKELPQPNSTVAFKHIFKQLGCKNSHRGFIVVSKRT